MLLTAIMDDGGNKLMPLAVIVGDGEQLANATHCHCGRYCPT